MRREIVVGIVTGLTLTILYAVWNFIVLIPSQIKIQAGAVVAFELDECPQIGWEEYKPAYGMFVRGIDRSGKEIDPEGERYSGQTQADSFQGHGHRHEQGTGASNVTGTFLGVYGNDIYSKGRVREPVEFGDFGDVRTDSETRPKNVALLYCRKT